jgi:hypothetical protein
MVHPVHLSAMYDAAIGRIRKPTPVCTCRTRQVHIRLLIACTQSARRHPLTFSAPLTQHAHVDGERQNALAQLAYCRVETGVDFKLRTNYCAFVFGVSKCVNVRSRTVLWIMRARRRCQRTCNTANTLDIAWSSCSVDFRLTSFGDADGTMHRLMAITVVRYPVFWTDTDISPIPI